MSAALKYIPHYTIAEYRDWEGDWELWSGIPISMSPSPFGKHQAVASRLAFELRRAMLEANCQGEVLHEIDWIVSDDTVVRPDVLICCGTIPQRHVESAPSLVAEVLSNATRERDQTFKRDLYRDHGVGTYLILDPDVSELVMWSQGNKNRWTETKLTGQTQLHVCDDCELFIDCASIFP